MAVKYYHILRECWGWECVCVCVCDRERTFEGLPVITGLITSSKLTMRSTDTRLLKLDKNRSYWLRGTYLEQDVGII